MSKEPKDKPTASVYSSPEKLKAALKDYLLTKGHDSMGIFIRNLAGLFSVKSGGESVRLKGDTGFFRSLVIDLLEEWDITPFDKEKSTRMSPSLGDIHIPTVQERLSDMPFVITYFVHDQLSRHTKDFAVSDTASRSISLTLLLFLMGYPNWDDFEQLKSFIAISMRTAGRKRVTFRGALAAGKDMFHKVDRIAGVWGKPRSGNIRRLDEKTEGIIASFVTRPHLTGDLIDKYVGFHRQGFPPDDLDTHDYYIPINSVFQAMSNIYKLSELSKNVSALPQKESRRIENCFSLRRQGLAEDEIAGRLRMEKWQYQNWTESHGINIKFKRPDKVLRMWHEAKGMLLGSDDSRINADQVDSKLVLDSDKFLETSDGQTHEYEIRKDGDFMFITFRGEKLPRMTSHLNGIRFILHLLENPNVDFPVLDLDVIVNLRPPVETLDELPQELQRLDEENFTRVASLVEENIINIGENKCKRYEEQALRTYFRRVLKRTEVELQTARIRGDIDQEEQAEKVKASLKKQLHYYFDKRGRLRPEPGDADKTRKRISKNISDTCKHIKRHNSELVQHLKCIKCRENKFSFRPPEDENIEWHIFRDDRT